MDILFFKVFKNQFLFNYIFNFIRNSTLGYYSINEFKLNSIFKDRKLFEIKYSSFIYFKDVIGDIEKCKFEFNNLKDYSQYFFKCSIINLKEFNIIYNQFKFELFSRISKNQILKWCIENENINNSIQFIQYLIDHQSFKFNIYNYHEFINLICSKSKSKETDDDLKLFNFINLCFKNYSFNFKKFIDYQKKNNLQILPNLYVKALYECFKNKKVCLYKPIYELCKSSIKDHYKFICKVVVYGAYEMANIYIEEFPNKQCELQGFIRFSQAMKSVRGYDFFDILKTYWKFVANNTLKDNHYPFYNYKSGYDYFYVGFISFKEFIPLLDRNRIDGKIKISDHNSIITGVYDLESLKYLEENQDQFIPPLKFEYKSILIVAIESRNFQLVQYIFDSYSDDITLNSKLDLSPYIKDTSLEIIKYIYDKFPNVYNDSLAFLHYLNLIKKKDK